MKLREWRKKHRLSQHALAAQLEQFAHEHYGDKAKKLPQTTVSSWERDTLPRKFWLMIIPIFTKGKVTTGDFVISKNANYEQQCSA